MQERHAVLERLPGGPARSRVTWLLAPALAVALLAAAPAVAPSAVPSPAMARAEKAPRATKLTPTAKAKRAGKILAPRSGASLQAAPVAVRVAATKRTRLSATVNGGSVRERFGRLRHGRRTLILSPSHGLRYGTNVVRVRAVTGRRTRRTTLSFYVRRSAPLAAAGTNRDMTVATALPIRDGRSLTPSGKPLRSRWRVIDAPRGAAGNRALAGSFRPTTPGDYTLRLTATAGAQSGSDDVTITVKSPPMVAVDTMAKASIADIRAGAAKDARGVRVGRRFFAADTRRWLQLVVLERDTLEEVAAKDIDCPQATADAVPSRLAVVQPCIDATRSYLKTLSDDHLVIASAQPSGDAPGSTDAWRAQPPLGVPEALSGIGVRAAAWAGASPLLRGRISAIGVPGWKTGAATVHQERGLGDQSRVGTISGFLLRDNDLHYGYVSEEQRYETQASGSNAAQNVVEVGDRRFPVTTPWSTGEKTRGGFQIVVLDRTNPDVGAQSRFFPTGRAVFDSGTVGRLNAMSDFLRAANDAGDKLIIVAGRGNTAFDQPHETWPGQIDINAAATRVVDQLERAGGTRTAGFEAIAPYLARTGFSYTLVGTSKVGVAKGIEQQGSAKTPDGALNTAPLSGTLSRDHAYRLTPGTADASRLAVENGTVTSKFAGHVSGRKLMETMMAAPSLWPEQGDPGRTAAIAYLSSQTFVGTDVRTEYWDANHGDKFWAGKQDDIAKVAFPAADAKEHGFDESDFRWAKEELHDEIDWVGQVRDFIREQVATPFTTGNLTKWADYTSAASTIRNAIQVPGPNKVTATLKALFDAAREGAGLIPGPVGKGFEIGNAVFNLAMELIEIGTPEQEDAGVEFTARADELGPELAKRLDEAQESVLQRYPEMIVSDYAKLKRVAACAQQRVADCRDAADWRIDKNDQLGATRALQIAMRTELLGTLLPARYTLWQLAEDCAASAGYTCREGDFQGDGFGGRVFLGKVCPFLSAPAAGKMTAPARRDIPFYRAAAGFGNSGNDILRVYALGQRDGGGTINSPYAMNTPGGDLVKRYLAPLFAPVDRDDPYAGQGQQKERFYRQAFPVVRMDTGSNAFPFKDTTMGWFGRDTGCAARP